MTDNIKQSIIETIKLVVAYLKNEHSDTMDDDTLFKLMKSVEDVLVNNSKGITTTWDKVNPDTGKQMGYSYIAGYAIALLREMVNKRWEPKHHLGIANTMVKKLIKKRRASNRSEALRIAIPRARSRAYLNGKSIADELRTFLEACDMGMYEQVVDSYRSLRSNAQGVYGEGYPVKKVAIAAVKLCIAIAEATGYN